VPTYLSQNALAFGARIGVRTILMPSEKHLVEAVGELGIPVVDQEPRGSSFLLERHGQVPRLLGDPSRVGCEVTPPR
jgi:hypothetical protein